MEETCQTRIAFRRTIDGIYNHSWRANRGSSWIWVPKPIALGGSEYPARAEEIRREGWKANRVFGLRPPPPQTKTIFLYLICHDFRKIIGRIKIFEKCTSDAVAHGVRLLPPHRTALGVPAAVGHGGRGAAHSRQYWPVGSVPNAAAHGVRKS
jgi:hypothetical protein